MLKALSLSAVLAAASASMFTNEWRYVQKSLGTQTLRFQVALPSRNMDWLLSELDAVSNPANTRYGQWLTGAEVAKTSADPAVRAEVRAWLEGEGAVCEDRPTSLKCVGTVEQVESLLAVDVAVFEHKVSGRRVHRVHPTAVATFPEHIKDKVAFITGLADFPSPQRRLGTQRTVESADTDYVIVLETVWDMYQTPSAVGTNTTGTTTAPAEFQDDSSWAVKDLSKFANSSGVAPWSIVKKIGPFQPANPDTEATLDVEQIGGIANGVTNQWYWTEVDWMYEFSEDLLNSTATGGNPDVVSISWGWYELDQCTISPVGPCTNKTNSAGFVAAVNANFAKAGATGVTLIVASGDSGAHGRTDPSCKSNVTRPDWPAASPYVLAVGATQILNGVSSGAKSPICQSQYQCATGGTEVVASPATGALIASGGGFSDVAAQPTWQSAAVTAYLASGALIPPTGDFNPQNRGYPDVAGFGHNVYVQQASAGGAILVDGTSCAAPIWGGIMGQLNAARIAAGKAKLGFFPPALYSTVSQAAGAFTDITSGNNVCTENGCKKGCTGYGAAKGWDATTGFGTPVYPALLKAVLALP